MNITATRISGVFMITRPQCGDERGFLSRLFCADALRAAGWTKSVTQINHTFTAKEGGVRGMHFQYPPYAEMKLVSCIHGEVWDVAVDLRRGSPTFLHWHAAHLSPENHCALLIPEGCAHGFQALAAGSELVYCHSAAYAKEFEAGLRPDDPRLGICWPLPVCDLSARDASHPLIEADFTGVTIPTQSRMDAT